MVLNHWTLLRKLAAQSASREVRIVDVDVIFRGVLDDIQDRDPIRGDTSAGEAVSTPRAGALLRNAGESTGLRPVTIL